MRAIDVISIIIILSLSIWCWGGNAQPAPSVSGYRLNLQWPAAFCELNPGKCKSTPLPESFTIHGLWPHNRAGKLLENCRGNAFAANSIKGALRTDLNAFWPTVSREFANNQDFWRYEWDKHGVCSESREFTLTNYFQNAIALRKKADVLGALNQEGIFKPEDLKPRTGKDIKAAIEKHLKARPELSCPSNVFLAINLCVNRLATNFVHCPASANCENANLKFIPSVAGFRLNLQWPAAFCEVNPGKCKTPLPNSFTIQGLWPHNGKGELLEKCHGSSFDVKSVGNLQDMNALWPTISREFTSNQAFWKYQWEKHGTCSVTGVFTQTDYFKNAIALRKITDVLGALNKEGITPDARKTYLGRTIIAAIKKNLNARPDLVCSQSVLLAINLCVNKPATQFLDCPASADCVSANLKFIPPAPPASVSLYTPI